MRVLDPGHRYEVDIYDSEPTGPVDVTGQLMFMKRMGPMYPGNTTAHPGTNCQELLRVLIDRVRHMDAQDPCIHNSLVLKLAQQMLWLFEDRAIKRHGITADFPVEGIENYPACKTCGHIICKGH